MVDKGEILWKQIARIDWLREGDSNTKFFHRRASSRKRKNTITCLEDTGGKLRTDDESIEMIISKYFLSIFQSKVNDSSINWDLMIDI